MVTSITDQLVCVYRIWFIGSLLKHSTETGPGQPLIPGQPVQASANWPWPSTMEGAVMHEWLWSSQLTCIKWSQIIHNHTSWTKVPTCIQARQCVTSGCIKLTWLQATSKAKKEGKAGAHVRSLHCFLQPPLLNDIWVILGFSPHRGL